MRYTVQLHKSMYRYTVQLHKSMYCFTVNNSEAANTLAMYMIEAGERVSISRR